MDAVDKKNPLSGNYDTRDKRLIKKQEFANVNFSMGNDTSKSKNLQIFDIFILILHINVFVYIEMAKQSYQ